MDPLFSIDKPFGVSDEKSGPGTMINMRFFIKMKSEVQGLSPYFYQEHSRIHGILHSRIQWGLMNDRATKQMI